MPPITVTLYGISNCDQVRKARKWLAAHAVAVNFVDYRQTPPPPAQLLQWLNDLGADALVNRRSTTWRQLSDAEHDAAHVPEPAAALLHAHPTLIKRPVIVWPRGTITVGCVPERWLELIAR